MLQRNTSIDSIFLPVKLVVLGCVNPPNNMGKIFSKISKWVYTNVKKFVPKILGMYDKNDLFGVYQQPSPIPGEISANSQLEKMSDHRTRNDSLVELDSQLTGKGNFLYIYYCFALFTWSKITV